MAAYQGGEWRFAAPRGGMSLVDLSTGQISRYHDGWQSAGPVAAATGGSVVDVEARSSIAQIIAALKAAGILA